MAVELREITRENFNECIGLKVGDDQKAFVSENVLSIAQARILAELEIRAVYSAKDMVGFVMYGLDTAVDRYFLVRLMIDKGSQRLGFGRWATEKVIEELRKQEACDAVYLYYVPENHAARTLYRSIGFEETGDVDEKSGEILMRYDFK